MEEYKQSLQVDRRQLLDRYHFAGHRYESRGSGQRRHPLLLLLLIADEDDPLFLQIKEARRSVLESPRGKSRYAHQGLRVVEGQRVMQGASDIFLGWCRSGKGHDYYVRQFRDMKVSAEVETFQPQHSDRIRKDVRLGCGESSR